MSSATPAPGLPRELDPTVVSPGLVGLFFFVALFVAVFFLMRSMVKQLRRIDIPGDNDSGPPPEGERPLP